MGPRSDVYAFRNERVGPPARSGADLPAPDALLTGAEFRERYLEPLATSMRPHIHEHCAVAAIGRSRRLKGAIPERYSSREDYLKQFRAAAEKLVADRFLLSGDVDALVQRGGQEWDWDKDALSGPARSAPVVAGDAVPGGSYTWLHFPAD